VLATGGLSLAGSEVRKRKIGTQSCFGAAELGVVGGECSGKDGDGFWASETREGVSAPTREVDGVKGEVGPVCDAHSVFGEEAFGVGEGAQAGVLLSVRGERLAMGGGEPRTQEQWTVAPDLASVCAQGRAVASSSNVGEHDGLFSEGMREQGG
jgi:hypothetical protein